MKKNIFKIFLFTVLTILIIRGTSIFYLKNSNGSLIYSKFFNIPNNLEIANFGSSHGLESFIYEEMNNKLRSFNFALDSQTIQYDNRILQQYIDCFDDNAIVIITLSYMSFYQGDHSNYFEQVNFRYHYFLKPKFIKEFSVKDYLLYGIFPIITAGENKFGIDAGHPYINPVVENRYSADELAEIAVSRVNYHYDRIKQGYGEYEEIVTSDLCSMIELCLENNLNVVLVTTPFTSFYNDNYPEEMYDNFYKNIDILLNNYDISYFDYSHNENFSHNYDLFRDSDHLNALGAAKFMKLFEKDIIDAEYIIIN